MTSRSPSSSRPPLPAPLLNAADRPIAQALHPIETGNYRIATPAIQAFSDARRPLPAIPDHRRVDLRALAHRQDPRDRVPAPAAGSETHPTSTTYHAQAEHKPRHAEGPFFANLLEAVGLSGAGQRHQSGQAHAPDQQDQGGLRAQRQRHGGPVLRRGAALRRERVRVAARRARPPGSAADPPLHLPGRPAGVAGGQDGAAATQGRRRSSRG